MARNPESTVGKVSTTHKTDQAAESINAQPRRLGKRAKVDHSESVKLEICKMKAAKFSHQQICERLGKKPRPSNAAWNHPRGRKRLNTRNTKTRSSLGSPACKLRELRFKQLFGHISDFLLITCERVSVTVLWTSSRPEDTSE